MQQGKIYAFIEIPGDLQKDVYSGHQPTIHYYYNQSFFVAGSLLLRDMEIMLNTISSGVNLQTRQLKGQDVQESMAQILPIVPEIHAIGNPYMNYSVYLSNILLPGMLQLMILMHKLGNGRHLNMRLNNNDTDSQSSDDTQLHIGTQIIPRQKQQPDW